MTPPAPPAPTTAASIDAAASPPAPMPAQPTAPPQVAPTGPTPAADAAAPPAASPPRRAVVRSFVLRGGRMGPGQQRALDTLGPRFVLPFQPGPLDLDAVFGRQAPRVLEIGFGMGDATAEVAAAQPHTDFLAVEVHEPGVGALLKRIGERGLGNLRLIRHDAVEVLRHMLPPQSLAGIHVWFPDPWHKKRHHKRRLIQPAFVALLASRLAPGGHVHCATDWQPYAEQMLAVLGAEPLLANTAAADGFVPCPPWRPQTKFERRGLGLGHGVWDLVFTRRTDAPLTAASQLSSSPLSTRS
jgi:tRNA (guanine-N7-)-methyltransferase